MSHLKPEKWARVRIDRKLNKAGWPVREAPMKGGSKPITCSSTGKQQPFSKLNAKR